jgi:hypothetical protein
MLSEALVYFTICCYNPEEHHIMVLHGVRHSLQASARIESYKIGKKLFLPKQSKTIKGVSKSFRTVS